MSTPRPFTAPTSLTTEQQRIMYLGLPTKGRLVVDPNERDLIDRALREDPDDYFLWCARATQTTDPAEAIDSYSQALRIRPLSSHVLYNRGRKLLGSTSTAMAAADLRAATLLDPDEPWKWHFLGVALYFLGRFDDAAQTFEEAATAASRAGEDLLPFEIEWMWNCYVKRGDLDAARQCLERVDEGTPVLESEATYKRRILLYRGLLSETDFLDGIDRDDPIETANQLYGYANHLYYNRRDVAGSLAALKEVLETAPGGTGWGAKMAALDLPERVRESGALTTRNDTTMWIEKGESL